MPLNVRIKKLVSEAKIPTYAHDTDMGMDIYCTSREYDKDLDRYIYHTGLAFEVPEGYGMLIFPRSSNTKKEVYLANSVGILDSGYRGELMFIYKDRTHRLTMPRYASSPVFPYEVGDRIGQIVIIPYPKINFIESDSLEKTDRGEGGFGSTGK